MTINELKLDEIISNAVIKIAAVLDSFFPTPVDNEFCGNLHKVIETEIDRMMHLQGHVAI